MKKELGGTIMAEFATLRPKTYGPQKSIIKQKLKLDYKHFLEPT